MAPSRRPALRGLSRSGWKPPFPPLCARGPITLAVVSDQRSSSHALQLILGKRNKSVLAGKLDLHLHRFSELGDDALGALEKAHEQANFAADIKCFARRSWRLAHTLGDTLHTLGDDFHRRFFLCSRFRGRRFCGGLHFCFCFRHDADVGRKHAFRKLKTSRLRRSCVPLEAVHDCDALA